MSSTMTAVPSNHDILIEIRDDMEAIAKSTGGEADSPTANPITVMSNASATSGYVAWVGGRGVAYVTGTFGGATVALETRWTTGGSPISIGKYASFTAPGGCGFELPAGAEVRATVTGGTGVSVSVILVRTMV